MSKNSLLESQILSVAAYFALFDYPLTLVEMCRYLPRGVRLAEAVPFLNEVRPQGWLARHHGFVFSQKKLRRARIVAMFFRHFPFVRFIGVANRVGWGAAQKDSDIDFFIAAKKGRLWLARLFVTGCAAFLRLRPTPSHIADTICLSFYIVDEPQDLGSLRFREDDIHFAFWLAQVLPLYDAGGVFARLLEKNYWLSDFFSAETLAMLGGRVARAREDHSFVQRLCEWTLKGATGDWCEQRAKKFQVKILNQKKTSVAVPFPSAVVYNDEVLKLHWNDRRKEWYQKWRERLKEQNTPYPIGE